MEFKYINWEESQSRWIQKISIGMCPWCFDFFLNRSAVRLLGLGISGTASYSESFLFRGKLGSHANLLTISIRLEYLSTSVIEFSGSLVISATMHDGYTFIPKPAAFRGRRTVQTLQVSEGGFFRKGGPPCSILICSDAWDGGLGVCVRMRVVRIAVRRRMQDVDLIFLSLLLLGAFKVPFVSSKVDRQPCRFATQLAPFFVKLLATPEQQVVFYLLLICNLFIALT